MTPEAINAIAELGAERARAQKVAAKAVLDANDLRRSLSDAQGEVRSLKADLVFVKAERDALKERLDIERAERAKDAEALIRARADFESSNKRRKQLADDLFNAVKAGREREEALAAVRAALRKVEAERDEATEAFAAVVRELDAARAALADVRQAREAETVRADLAKVDSDREAAAEPAPLSITEWDQQRSAELAAESRDKGEP